MSHAAAATRAHSRAGAATTATQGTPRGPTTTRRWLHSRAGAVAAKQRARVAQRALTSAARESHCRATRRVEARGGEAPPRAARAPRRARRLQPPRGAHGRPLLLRARVAAVARTPHAARRDESARPFFYLLWRRRRLKYVGGCRHVAMKRSPQPLQRHAQYKDHTAQ